MKIGKSLQELAAELTRQQESKRDFHADTRSIGFTSDERQSVLTLPTKEGTERFPVTPHTHSQIAQRLEIPKAYYDTMRVQAPGLLDTNVNHWLQKTKETRLIRTLNGNARAFLSDKYRPLDNFDLAEIALPALMEAGCRVESCEVTESRLYIKAVTERIQFEVKKGDIVQAGIVISNSEIGAGSLSVEPLIFRLVCLNGMIANDAGMRKYHTGKGMRDFEGASEFYRDETRLADDKAFWLKVRDTIKGSLSQIGFEKIANRLIESTNEPITKDPIAAVTEIAKQLTLSETERTGVLSELLKAGDMSRFGMVQALTATAHTLKDLDYDRSTEFERFGGRILELPKTDWNRISIAA